MKAEELRTDAGLKTACEAVSRAEEPKDSYRGWVEGLEALLERVRHADREVRASRDFQQVLWEMNPVSSVGMGQVSVDGLLDQSDYREWIADVSLEPLPDAPEERRNRLRGIHRRLPPHWAS